MSGMDIRRSVEVDDGLIIIFDEEFLPEKEK
jgi:hypothetical protein